MALQVLTMSRTFTMQLRGGETPLADPDPNLSPEQVMAFYANLYPELTNGCVTGPEIIGDQVAYTIKATVGLKG
jgi:PRTRC genetic system protein C